MEKMDPENPKLTENDKSVLKMILDTRKVPDSDIAKVLNLSPQAIFKIRSKLENIGIIKGYMPIVDYKKLGINVMVVLIIRFLPKVWASFSDDKMSDRISKASYVIDAYRVADESASHILVLAFRNTIQKEKYISEMQIKFANEVEIMGAYTFSVDKIIAHGTMGILHEVIDKKEFAPSDLFKI